MPRLPKHDYHNAVTGEYMFSMNACDFTTIEKLEAHKVPVRVYRNSKMHITRRYDRRFLRYATPHNGSADNRGYYKYATVPQFDRSMLR